MAGINLLEALSDNIVIDRDKCTACGICVETCVLDNLRLKLAPCRQACPLEVNAQGYVQLIARGEEDKARQILGETLPFPGILGRICSRPCEAGCHRAQITGQAVSIRALKRYLTEDGPENPLPEREPDSGRKVAVVGSGPAGLMAGHDLRVKGHQVIVFEAEAEPGGLLRWAIPEFRLPAEVVGREVDRLERLGLEFRCGRGLGREVSLDELRAGYDAVVLATGAGAHGRLGLEGESLIGVHFGLPLLRAVRAGQGPEMAGRVFVVGGGNVAVDAAQTALRLGAAEAVVVALEAEGELPAFAWAVEEARAEGVGFECGWGPAAILDQAGRVSGLELRRCLSVFDGQGRFRPAFDSGQTRLLSAETVIIAVGQSRDLSCLQGSGLLEGESLLADPLTLQTSWEDVFVAGDLHSGPSSVVQAMASGRAAAESADRFLRGEHLRFGRGWPGPVETEFEIDTSRGSADARVCPARRPFQGRGDFGELEAGLDREAARREAGRCYSCGQPFGRYRTCWFCLPCEVECPEQALYVEIPYLLR